MKQITHKSDTFIRNILLNLILYADIMVQADAKIICSFFIEKNNPTANYCCWLFLLSHSLPLVYTIWMHISCELSVCIWCVFFVLQIVIFIVLNLCTRGGCTASATCKMIYEVLMRLARQIRKFTTCSFSSSSPGYDLYVSRSRAHTDFRVS